MLTEFENSKLLAGETDRVLELIREKIEPQYIVDISKIEELKNICEDQENVYLGSMATCEKVLLAIKNRRKGYGA